MRNKYVNRAKISEAKFRELVRFFTLDLTAIQIAELTGLNRNTVNRYLTEIRKKISHYCDITTPLALQKFPIHQQDGFEDCCILIREYESKIYTEIIPTGLAFSDKKATENSIIPDLDYDLLINTDSGNHHFIGKKTDQPNQHRLKLNRIEGFWGSAKSRLAKFKGMHSSTFRYHMKECEFRFNNRNKDLYQLLLKILRNDPLF